EALALSALQSDAPEAHLLFSLPRQPVGTVRGWSAGGHRRRIASSWGTQGVGDTANQHTHSSSYRERLIEHLFLGELLKVSWLLDSCSLEVSKPEVDNSGYDAIAEARGHVRHIQMKASVEGSKTATHNVHLKLASKPSGCVVWIYFNPDTMQLGPYL